METSEAEGRFVRSPDQRPIETPASWIRGPGGPVTWLCAECGVHIARGFDEDQAFDRLIRCPNCWSLNEVGVEVVGRAEPHRFGPSKPGGGD
jgi:hypothetical protein